MPAVLLAEETFGKLSRTQLFLRRVTEHTSNVERGVDADCGLFLQFAKTLGGSFIHNQVQCLVQHNQFHTVKLPIIYCFHTKGENKEGRESEGA